MIFDRRRYARDNYVYLLAEGADGALVDPGDPNVALALAAAHAITPRFILHTHGHGDHSGGSAELRRRLGTQVHGHGADAAWFAPDVDLAGVRDLTLGALSVRVHPAPGHTPGSVLFEWRGRLLTGDTLFWGGCGNCKHGGDPARLAETFLGPIAALDGALEIHPGHDYAETNLSFALHVDPSNAAVRAQLAAARAARAADLEPRPTTLADERASNPFLRASTVDEFLELRRRKDFW